MSAEKRLVHELLADYKEVGVVGRPTVNLTHPVHVQFGLGLIQMEVEEKENMLRLSAWTKYVSLGSFPCEIILDKLKSSVFIIQ